MGNRRAKRRVILVICVALLLAGVIVGVFLVRGHVAREEAVREQERQIAEAYRMANYILWYSDPREAQERDPTVYRPFRKVPSEENPFGICYYIYVLLLLYERETGNRFTYEAVVDYFSQEFEPDGSLRLFNNGKHPEMEAFVDWAWNAHSTFVRYLDYISDIWRAYLAANEGVDIPWHTLSPQMLDALARAEADPDYVLDLTSLQRAGD
ncbi:MAG: hypothetical protein FWC72_01025 [Oscillospiraceae bacterium]|nr:hypothetical protein [Oscillospiraceae bacterium]